MSAGASGLAVFCAVLIFYSRVQHNTVTYATRMNAGYALTSQREEMVDQLLPMSVTISESTPRVQIPVTISESTPCVQIPRRITFICSNQTQQSISRFDMTSLSPPSYLTSLPPPSYMTLLPPPSYNDVLTQSRFTQNSPTVISSTEVGSSLYFPMPRHPCQDL